MKIFKYDKYHEDTGGSSSWAKIADGREVTKDKNDGNLYVRDEIHPLLVASEWCVDTELSDMEKYTIKKEVRKTVSLLYEAWDRLSGLNNTIDAVDFKEADKIDELVYDLNKYLKEEL